MPDPRRDLTDEEKAALQAVADRPDSEIDLTDPDAPEVRNWSDAVRGALFRAEKPFKRSLDAAP
ncbi:hypothetical protein [Pararhodospirillum oryzae]|uniref:Uncharacterized protein n=1 Tax=Pararhodospirillum oryzae TaxID=478448 RepID=A0A512H7J5_9PROT|nr:hypothetical protein [Pararhodospirillum oryzae]GEO81427.1 hypothetical protein ROR02_15580 [Pararhodospirillum oryzae]